MLKKWSFWIPLGIAIALAVTLGLVVGDPFGTDLTTYVQAVSTLVLVAVTTSYVIATYSIAQISEEQLALKRSQRGLDAVTELWTEFSETQMLARFVIADAKTMQHIAKSNVNDLHMISAAAKDRREKLTSFATAFNRLSLHVPEPVAGPGERLVMAHMDVYMVGNTLANEIQRAIARTSAEGTGFDAPEFGDYWDNLSELIYDGLPTWDTFNLEPQQQKLETAMSDFRTAARDYVKHGS